MATPETRDKPVLRAVVDRQRVGQFFEPRHAFITAVRSRQRQRFNLVVGGSRSSRVTEFLMKAFDLDAQFRPQFCIEIGKRFVEQEHRRRAHQCTTDRNTLTLLPPDNAEVCVAAGGSIWRISAARLITMSISPADRPRAIERKILSTVICG